MANRKLIDKALNFLAKPITKTITFTETERTSNAWFHVESVTLYKRGFSGMLKAKLKWDTTGTPPEQYARVRIQLGENLNIFGGNVTGTGGELNNLITAITNGSVVIFISHPGHSVLSAGGGAWLTIPLQFNK